MNALGEVRPGDPEYGHLLGLWQADGCGHYLEPRFTETYLRVIFPDGPSVPVFVVMASLPGLTTPELFGPISGVQAAMATWQRTWHGKRRFPHQFSIGG